MDFIAELRNRAACQSGITWAEDNNIKSVAEALQKLHRPDWMLWLIDRFYIDVTPADLRRFACRCVRETPIGDGRTVWDLLTDQRSRNAVEVAERYADGEATTEELAAARDSAWDAAQASARDFARNAAWSAAWSDAWDAEWDSALAAARDAAWSAAWDSARDSARAKQADILREIIAPQIERLSACGDE